jgi:23S rRNA (uracil1939-C5)-methyltransferase
MVERRNAEPAGSDAAQVAEVHGLSHDGRGIARVDGKTVFIDGALPGERVTYKLGRRRRNYDNAELVEVLRASPQRVQPRCPAFGTCGGCSLQHLDTRAQIAAKQQTMLDNLLHIGKCTPLSVRPALTGPVWGYRRKARLGVRNVPKKGGVLVGFREKAKSYIADMRSCDVLAPRIAALLPTLRDLIGGLSCRDRVPQIEVACGDEECALVFRHLVPLGTADLDALRAFGEAHDIQIHLQPGGLDSIHALWPQPAPQLSYALPAHKVEIRFDPADFVQVNADINRAMVDAGVELLDPRPSERVLDLFCGLGNFTLPIARRAGNVVGLEADPLLIERARANAAHNGIGSAEFIPVNLYEEPLEGSWLNRGYDKILIDPPRTGAVEICKRIGDLGAGRIVYVSCNPATLARDAEILVHAHGYRLMTAGVMDMFPHTAHVESIALFERA